MQSRPLTLARSVVWPDPEGVYSGAIPLGMTSPLMACWPKKVIPLLSLTAFYELTVLFKHHGGAQSFAHVKLQRERGMRLARDCPVNPKSTEGFQGLVNNGEINFPALVSGGHPHLAKAPVHFCQHVRGSKLLRRCVEIARNDPHPFPIFNQAEKLSEDGRIWSGMDRGPCLQVNTGYQEIVVL